MRSVLLSAIRYVGLPAGRALAIYGQVFGPLVPPPYFPEPPRPAGTWDAPPPGHPERLRPDLPYSETELVLLRQLGTGLRRRG